MFGYFNKNKFISNEKGQLIPVFIVIIVVLIVMAMLTVNLAKVGLIKTESSNAADAGALAGGSVMASIFNGQAIANSELIVNYQMFFAEMAVLTAVTIIAAIVAASSCNVTCTLTCPDACGSTTCTIAMRVAIAGVIAAMVAIIAFHIAQYFTYRNMAKQADEGREQAIEMAYRYAFLNSGIGNKLSSGSSSATAYNDFVKGEGVTSGNYAWTDGQGRQHQVNVNVRTGEIDNYKLKYTALPTAVAVGLLIWALLAAIADEVSCKACPCSLAAVVAATEKMIGAMAVVLAGLVPAFELDTSVLANVLFPICWVVDINHDRRLTVTTSQEHAGYDYGLWQTTYPRVESKSVVSFQGNGKIYQPNPRFDADIVETD